MNARAVACGAVALACLLASAVARSQVPPVPHFVDETDAAGIQSRFDGDWEYTVGGGVAALDCDGSGLPSLFIAPGRASSLIRNLTKAKSARMMKLPEGPRVRI